MIPGRIKKITSIVGLDGTSVVLDGTDVALDGTAVAVAVVDAAVMEHKSDIHAEPLSTETPPQPTQLQETL